MNQEVALFLEIAIAVAAVFVLALLNEKAGERDRERAQLSPQSTNTKEVER